jgi:hypothetical protein
MARRGRPRDPNAKRRQTTSAGRAPDADYGTICLQLRRAEMIGAPTGRIEGGKVFTEGDAALSASTLGVLLARGLIDRRQFEAGERYQRLAWAAYGRPFARGLDIARPRGTPAGAAEADTPDHDDLRRSGARHALAKADARLAALDRAALGAVKRACQNDQADGVLHAPLLSGLDALARMWGLGCPTAGR